MPPSGLSTHRMPLNNESPLATEGPCLLIGTCKRTEEIWEGLQPHPPPAAALMPVFFRHPRTSLGSLCILLQLPQKACQLTGALALLPWLPIKNDLCFCLSPRTQECQTRVASPDLCARANEHGARWSTHTTWKCHPNAFQPGARD